MSCEPSEKRIIGRIVCDGWPERCPNGQVMVLDNPRERVMASKALGDRLFVLEEEALKYAAQFGWAHKEGCDLCPGCKVKRERDRT